MKTWPELVHLPKQLLHDPAGRPIAVVLNYQDWLDIQTYLQGMPPTRLPLPTPYQIQPVSLGHCHLDNLDNIAQCLSDLEGDEWK